MYPEDRRALETLQMQTADLSAATEDTAPVLLGRALRPAALAIAAYGPIPSWVLQASVLAQNVTERLRINDVILHSSLFATRC